MGTVTGQVSEPCPFAAAQPGFELQDRRVFGRRGGARPSSAGVRRFRPPRPPGTARCGDHRLLTPAPAGVRCRGQRALARRAGGREQQRFALWHAPQLPRAARLRGHTARSSRTRRAVPEPRAAPSARWESARPEHPSVRVREAGERQRVCASACHRACVQTRPPGSRPLCRASKVR